MKIISKKATLIDADGLISGKGLTVIDHGDSISIGGTEHLKKDLMLSSHTIRSTVAKWEVQMDSVLAFFDPMTIQKQKTGQRKLPPDQKMTPKIIMALPAAWEAFDERRTELGLSRGRYLALLMGFTEER